MTASGLVAVTVDWPIGPLRNAPRFGYRLFRLLAFPSFARCDSIKFESLTTGDFHRIIPAFGNFDDRSPPYAIVGVFLKWTWE